MASTQKKKRYLCLLDSALLLCPSPSSLCVRLLWQLNAGIMASHSSKALLVVIISLLSSSQASALTAQSTQVPTSIVSAAAPASTNSSDTLSSIPECTRPCLTKATLSLPCEATDTQCLCAHSQQIHDRTLTCLAGSTCSESDIDLTANYYDDLCLSLGYPLSAVGTEIATATSPSPTSPELVSSASSSSIGATGTSATQQSSPGQKSTLKVSIIVGVAIGVAIVLIGTIAAGCWFLGRRRRQEEHDQAEKIFTSPTSAPTATSSTTIVVPVRPASSMYSPSSSQFPTAIDVSTRKPSVLSTSTTYSQHPSSPRHTQQTWNAFPSQNHRNRKSNATIETTFTSMTNQHRHASVSRHLSTISSQSQKPKQNPRVREIEIRRPQRVISEEVVVKEAYADDSDDYASGITESEDEEPQRSFATARSVHSSKSNRSTRSRTTTGSGGAGTVQTSPVRITTQQISPGLGKFDFGLGSPGTPRSMGSQGTVERAVWGDGPVEKSRHFV